MEELTEDQKSKFNTNLCILAGVYSIIDIWATGGLMWAFGGSLFPAIPIMLTGVFVFLVIVIKTINKIK